MDFKSFAQGKGADDVKEANEASGEAVKLNSVQEAALKRKIKHYEKMSESELLQEFTEKVEESKLSGKLSPSDIDGFASVIRPYLNPEQTKKLESVLKMIK
ncbi:MAG: hypothetical protein LBT55_00240 [Clostridiaceae bacterium]|jgi:hypothetical protein|nr:hypothetical protein [Clostridiaceae bacterium]